MEGCFTTTLIACKVALIKFSLTVGLFRTSLPLWSDPRMWGLGQRRIGTPVLGTGGQGGGIVWGIEAQEAGKENLDMG